ncbi:hypothetical protein PPYR_02024 [Photinus pyralis]|uniref:Uncharacterized protein n=1 Tax=Photinus pyralis TaxID=7054 RepID=A0A5N4B674_PHOPY|nr:hypothetical protein PPYR_02024 [Photinus pyralis]
MRLLVSLPTGKHIESFTELMRSNLSISLDAESWMIFRIFSFISNDVPIKELKQPLRKNDDPYNLTKSWYADKSFVFDMLLKTLQSIELRLQVSPPPYFVDTELFPTITNVFVSEKCFYFIDSLDVFIDRLTESGLYDKLEQDRKFYAEKEKSKFISE